MSSIQNKKETVKLLLSKGVIINSDILNSINSIKDLSNFNLYLNSNTDLNVTRDNVMGVIDKYNSDVLNNLVDNENCENQKNEDKIECMLDIDPNLKSNVKIVYSYEGEPKKRVPQDFVKYFGQRYNRLKKMLMLRKELSNPTSISKVIQKTDREEVAVIGLISSKNLTKNGNIIMDIEDNTGIIKVLVSKNKTENLNVAKDFVLDEAIGVVGQTGDNIIFANTILTPDVPLSKELKKCPEEVYSIFIGDMHFGSKVFFKNQFNKFINWLNGLYGTDEQKAAASKVRYVFIVGDLVEGVGIFPNQDEELDIKDIYLQYEEFAKYLQKIPSHIKIIICPGNHDAMRIAEPQPPLYKDFAESIWKLPNAVIVSNPAVINIHASDLFEGFDVLMYHGFSFIYYSEQVESIRAAGGQKRVDLIMKYLLQKRHLAPTHTSTLYLPDTDKDNLIIEKVPDFFVSGHIHRVSASSYRNVTLLNCSCWLDASEYQEKMGLEPQPCRALLANLNTRKVKILNFYEEKN